MTELYDYSTVKKQFFARIALTAIIAAIFIALYVVSFIPQQKWLTLLVGIAGAIICCSAGIFLLASVSAKYRLVRDIHFGLSVQDRLIFSHICDSRQENMTDYICLVFCATDETGREYTREILMEGNCPFNSGETVTVRTYRSYIVAYQKEN